MQLGDARRGHCERFDYSDVNPEGSGCFYHLTYAGVKEGVIPVSPPNDSVLFAPSRNVLLTRGRWELPNEGQPLMAQADRDRLVALKKAKDK